MSTRETHPEILPYHAPRDRRGAPAFSMTVAAACAVLVAFAILLVAVVTPRAAQIYYTIGAPATPPTRWLFVTAEWLRRSHHWVIACAVVATIPFIAPRFWRENADPLRRRRLWWRWTFILLALAATGSAVALAWPIVSLHHSLTARETDVDGRLHFLTESGLFAYIADKECVSGDPKGLAAFIAGCTTERIRWDDQRMLWIVAPTYLGISQTLRGAQFNGRYYLAIADAEGFTVVGELEGNSYSFSGSNETVTTAWHMGAGETSVTVYKWNGKQYQAVESTTTTMPFE